MKIETEKVDTTLGELVETLSDVALEFCSDEKEACLLVSLALEDVFLDDAFRRALCGLISTSRKHLADSRFAHAQ